MQNELRPRLTTPHPIIAIVYGDRAAAADVLRRLADRLAAKGARCCGFLQHDVPRSDRASCDMLLEDLTSRSRLRLSEDRGPGARGCRLDASELVGAVERARLALANGADVLFINKFGKTEAEGTGFRPVIAEALERGIPACIGVPRRNLDSWRAFAGGLACEHDAQALTGDIEVLMKNLRISVVGRDEPSLRESVEPRPPCQ